MLSCVYHVHLDALAHALASLVRSLVLGTKVGKVDQRGRLGEDTGSVSNRGVQVVLETALCRDEARVLGGTEDVGVGGRRVGGRDGAVDCRVGVGGGREKVEGATSWPAAWLNALTSLTTSCETSDM